MRRMHSPLNLQVLSPLLHQMFVGSGRMGYALGITFIQKRQYSTRKNLKKKGNYYDVLSLSPQATQSQIKSAYYDLSKTFHPDINKSVEAHERFAELSEAYETLGNVGKRRMYDRQTLNASSVPYDHSSFHTREGFRERPKTVYRGRTNIYNFDEFYRQHYENHRHRVETNKETILKKKNEEESSKGDYARNVFCVGLMFGMALAVWPFAFKSKRNDV